MDITLTIFLGVISGVITTAMLFIAGRLFYRVILPWFQEIKYQGVDLKGDWGSKSDEGEEGGRFEMHLSQNAHNLTGEATVFGSLTNTGGDRLGFYVVGTVWEGYVSLTLKSKDRRRVSFATLLLKVCGGGARLEGVLSHKSMKEDIVKSGKVTLTRDKI